MVRVIIIVVLGVIIVVAIAVAVQQAGWWPPAGWPPPRPGWWPALLPWPGTAAAPTPPPPTPPAAPPPPPASGPPAPYLSAALYPSGQPATPSDALKAHITVRQPGGQLYTRPSVVLTIREGAVPGITSWMALPSPDGGTTPGQNLGTSTPYIGTDNGHITFDIWGTTDGGDALEVSLNGVVIGTLPYETAEHR